MVTKNCASKFAALIVLCASFVAWAQDDFVELRSGRIPLRNASQLRTKVATERAAASTGGSNQQSKLYLVQFKKDTVWALRDTLQSGDGAILDVLSDSALLVRGKPDVVLDAASLHGALLAEYEATAKVSPEASKVIESAAPGRRSCNQRAALAQFSDAGTGSTIFAENTCPESLDDPNLAPYSLTSANIRSLETWTKPRGNHATNRKGTPSNDSETSDGPDLYGVNVRLAPGLSRDELLTVSQTWEGLLADALLHPGYQDACRPRLRLDGVSAAVSPFVHAFLCEEDLEDGVSWLTTQGQTMWAEPLLAASPLNAVAGLTVQTGTLTTAQYGDPQAFGPRPFWNASINGDGIIVGVTDSGLDMSHCYLIDDAYRTGSLRTKFVGSPPRLSLPSHRKIVQYVLSETTGIQAFVDNWHGSRVAGSIAGSILDNGSDGYLSDRATGAAPNARISFFGSSNLNTQRLTIPSPVDDKVLSYHYGVGARIGSDSWGHSSALGVAYTMTSREYDAFAWRNPDWISVVAAGNWGHNGMVSVVAPATAKNVISVGSSISYPKDTPEGVYNNLHLFRYRTTPATVQEFAVYPRLGSDPKLWRAILLNKEVPVRMADPEGACSPLAGNYKRSVVLVDLHQQPCTNETAYANAASSGAAAIIFIVDKELFLEELDTWSPINQTLTYALVSRAQGLKMRNISLTDTSDPVLEYLEYPSDKANFGIDCIAYFSSYGPLADNRIKPDLVAPGSPVESASGDKLVEDSTRSTCSRKTESVQGTSMAAPIVAGHLALMRQYFRDGFYPLGVSGNAISVPFEPSGMLLKAAAITGAVSLMGGVALATGKVMGAAPDGFQGWGRLDLPGVLPLLGSSKADFRLQVADYGVIQDNETLYLKGIRATGTGPVIATLVWHDYPASGLSAKALVNDLDLGFQINPGDKTTVYNRQRTDSSNNVERIELNNLKDKDEIVLVVNGRSVLHSLISNLDAAFPQRWAIAIAGYFTGNLKTIYNPAYMRPVRLLGDQMVMWLNSTHCTNAPAGVLFPTPTCNNTNSTLWLTEHTDPVLGGPLYTIYQGPNKCWMVSTNITGSPIVITSCNSTDPHQKFAFFANPYNSSTYLIAAQPFLGSRNHERRCIKLDDNSITLQAKCVEDDPSYNFRVVRGGLSPSSSLPSPSPSRSAPTPAPKDTQTPAPQLWSPYPLLFRTDFYPSKGAPNDYDYDYTGDSNVLESYSNLDIIVSWTLNETTYLVDYLNFADRTSNTGVVHGGDNINKGTMFEEVHWQLGYTPQPATYNVCVVWHRAETRMMRVKMTVFHGFAVATATKVFDTTAPSSSSVCDAISSGYVASYNVTAATFQMPVWLSGVSISQMPPLSPPALPSPPPPPSPSPPAPYHQYPLVFRADWIPVSGMAGRETKLVDMDIVVSFANLKGQQIELGTEYPNAGGGIYGGDNIDAKTNSEFVFWPTGSTPPATTYHVCVRWFDNKRPIMNVTLQVYREFPVANYTRMVDTNSPRSFIACTNMSSGYMASYTYIPPSPPPPSPQLLTSPPPSSTPPPPPPAKQPSPPAATPPPAQYPQFSLVFLVDWIPVSGATDPDTQLVDMDMVVAFSYLRGQYELGYNYPEAGGGIYGGDNMDAGTNSEFAYWPTSSNPPATTYHVCVRLYDSNRQLMNVTLQIHRESSAVVYTRMIDTKKPLNTDCTNTSHGYLGSLTLPNTAPSLVPMTSPSAQRTSPLIQTPLAAQKSAQTLGAAQTLTATRTASAAETLTAQALTANFNISMRVSSSRPPPMPAVLPKPSPSPPNPLRPPPKPLLSPKPMPPAPLRPSPPPPRSPTASPNPSTPQPEPQPSPPKASPSSSCEGDPTYMYGLYFRTQWSSANINDMTFYDWDMVVAWTSQGQSYELSPATPTNGGGVHLGDNLDIPPEANGEVAYWSTCLTGQMPQPAEYYVCVRWHQPGPLNVQLTVTLDEQTVVSINRTWSTTTPFSKRCTPDVIGFITSYTYNATGLKSFNASAPSNSGAPNRNPVLGAAGTGNGSLAPVVRTDKGGPSLLKFSSPKSSCESDTTYMYGIYFRTQWSPPNPNDMTLYDWDMVVAWTSQGQSYELSPATPTNGGGVHLGDNLDIPPEANGEVAFWSRCLTGQMPQPAVYHVCVRWHQPGSLNVQLTVTLDEQTVVSTNRTWSASSPFSKRCTPDAIGFIASYTYNAGGNLASGPNSPSPLPSSIPISNCEFDPTYLYFRTQWSSNNVSDTTFYDWDMVVTWTSQGQSYQLSPMKRFGGGGVHLGDNLEMLPKANGEVAVWPMGLTGQSPQAGEYYVCVRWYQPVSLNVQLAVSLDERTVATASRTWSTVTPFSKRCAPGVIGFIGSYTYNSAAIKSVNITLLSIKDGGGHLASDPTDLMGPAKEDSGLMEQGINKGGESTDVDSIARSDPGSLAAADAVASDGASSKGTDMKTVAYALGIGGAGVVAAVVLAVRQRRLRAARVIAK